MMADFAAEEIARRMLGVLEASKSAAAKYQAPSSDLQVLLIQSRATKEDLASQWQRVVGGRVIQETVGGNHLTMMQGEHLLQVARAISKHLTSPR